jgi:hypothetical protein
MYNKEKRNEMRDEDEPSRSNALTNRHTRARILSNSLRRCWKGLSELYSLPNPLLSCAFQPLSPLTTASNMPAPPSPSSLYLTSRSILQLLLVEPPPRISCRLQSTCCCTPHLELLLHQSIIASNHPSRPPHLFSNASDPHTHPTP